MRWYEGVPEIERKFKVQALPEHLLGPGSAIRQGYLSVAPAEIRLRAQDGGHELTVKSLGGLRRVEVALPLTRSSSTSSGRSPRRSWRRPATVRSSTTRSQIWTFTAASSRGS